nr:hypothetical protein Iba_chr13cCG13450 [Ipomoea batatas]
MKSNEETVGAEVRDAEVESVGLHQPNVSSPAPACETASMDASPPCHGNMQKAASNTTSPAANMDATFNPSSDVPVTLSNSNVSSVVEETVNMQVGAGGSNMVADFTGLKRRRTHDDEVGDYSLITVYDMSPVWKLTWTYSLMTWL